MAKTKKLIIESVEDNTELPMVSEIKTVELITEIAVGKLTSNAKEYKAAIEKELEAFSIERYLNNPDAAKSDKAYLNKLKDEVAEKRKTATKLWNSPLAEFENEMKTLEKTIDNASKQLKTIVDEAENKEREIKKKEIYDYWSTLDFKIISLDKIFNDKWLNKTYSMKQVMLDCEAAIEKYTTELETIKNSCEEEDREIGMSFYLETLNLNDTLIKLNQLKANRAALKTAEEQKKETVEIKTEPVTEQVTKTNIPQNSQQISQQIEEYTLRIKGPREKMFALRQFIINSGLEYTRL